MNTFQVSGSLAAIQNATAVVTDTDGNTLMIEVPASLRIDLMRAAKGAMVEITGQIVSHTKAMMGMAVHTPSFLATKVNVVKTQTNEEFSLF